MSEIKTPKRSLVYDISNILYRVAAAQLRDPYAKDASPDDLVGLCMHNSLSSIYKWYSKYKPDFIVFAFEGGNNWRKTFTADNKTRKQYKANRVYDPAMAHFYKCLEAFKQTMASHTSICCLCIDSLEGDDVIGGYAQLYAAPDHEIIIISGDYDFVQLLRLPNVKLVDSDTGKLRNQPGDKKYQEDLDYWIFLKAIRGDIGDYVPSAYPRVRETRIKNAYNHEYDRINFMNESWVDEEKVTHRVGDLFDQNVILVDLFKQPADIRMLIEEGVKVQVEQIGAYSHFQFLRFLETYKLQRVRENSMKFVDMFTNNQKFRKGQLVNKQPEVLVEKEEPASALLNF